MSRKYIALAFTALLVGAGGSSVSANSPCPDLSQSGMSDEEIRRFCDEWEGRGSGGGGSTGGNFPGVIYGYPLPSDRIPKQPD